MILAVVIVLVLLFVACIALYGVRALIESTRRPCLGCGRAGCDGSLARCHMRWFA